MPKKSQVEKLDKNDVLKKAKAQLADLEEKNKEKTPLDTMLAQKREADILSFKSMERAIALFKSLTDNNSWYNQSISNKDLALYLLDDEEIGVITKQIGELLKSYIIEARTNSKKQTSNDRPAIHYTKDGSKALSKLIKKAKKNKVAVKV